METRFHGLCVCFSGNFGVRSIVLCKCSGKYIDIYFSLKITYCLNDYLVYNKLVIYFEYRNYIV